MLHFSMNDLYLYAFLYLLAYLGLAYFRKYNQAN